MVDDARRSVASHGDPTARGERQSRPDRERDEVLLPESRRVENAAFAAMVARCIRAHGRRVADGDPEDLVAMLEVRDQVDEAIGVAVLGLREQGWSWAKIGRAVGITKQSAQERWGR